MRLTQPYHRPRQRPYCLAPRSGERLARVARRVRGDKASSREPELRGRRPSPADLRSAASPAARERRCSRCRGRKTGALVSKRESRSRSANKDLGSDEPRSGRGRGEAAGVGGGCGGPEVPLAERPARAARRVRGDRASSREPELRGRRPSPADRGSAASPAAREKRCGRYRGRRIGVPESARRVPLGTGRQRSGQR